MKITAGMVYGKWKDRYRSSAIYEHCRECCGDSADEVTFCTVLDCPLWGHRTRGGKKGVVSRMERRRKLQPKQFDEAYGFLFEKDK